MTTTVGIAGFGTIGRKVGAALHNGIPGLTLAAVTSGDNGKARDALSAMGCDVPVLSPRALASTVDVVVECAPTPAFASIVEPALEAGCTVITVSGAAILQHPDIIQRAQQHQGKIILATGALLGLDAVRAAAEGKLHRVTLVTRKPPTSLIKAKYIVENNIDINDLKTPLQVFCGSAREGAERFPSNVNVAAALGLAGIGADRTELEIWADPSYTRNTHFITVEADSARLQLTIENVPTDENPGTGKITALSIIATLRALTAPLRVGT